MEVENGALILRAPRKPREGWDAAFAEMANRGDALINGEWPATSWDQDEWQW